jgi:hypothetical protein
MGKNRQRKHRIAGISEGFLLNPERGCKQAHVFLASDAIV